MITEDLIQEISESLYSAALRQVPPDTLQALENAREREQQERARGTLDLMVRSAQLAEESDKWARERLPEIMATLAQRRDAAKGRN